MIGFCRALIAPVATLFLIALVSLLQPSHVKGQSSQLTLTGAGAGAPVSGASACTPQCMGDAFAGWSYFYSIDECYNFAYANSVVDIVNSGATLGSRIVCNGGVTSALVSASACTFVTGGTVNLCSPVATTCAVACSVKTLYDQAGGGFNVVQATFANMPSYTASCQNGHACATCVRASSQGWISASGPTVTIDATGNVIYALVNIVSTPGTGQVVFQTGESMLYGAGTIAKAQSGAGGTLTQSATMTVGATYAVIAQIFASGGSTSQTALNGSTTGQTTSTTAGNTSASGNVAICNNNSGTVFLDAKFMSGGLIKNPTGFTFAGMNTVTHNYWNN